MTLEGDLDLSANTATLHISNGLTFNGTITLSGSGARLSSDTTQTIDGRGTIAFAGTTGGTRHLSVEGNTTLTLGADLTVRGGHGQSANSSLRRHERRHQSRDDSRRRAGADLDG